jgi:hypothetical protein
MACISFIFLHLLSTNHKCTHPCYFPCYSKPATQKLEKIWNSLMSSSRLALPELHFPVDYGASCYFAFMRVIYSFVRQYLSNNKYFICDIWHVVITIFVHVYGNIVPGHTYDEYSILVSKSGMREVVIKTVSIVGMLA